MMWLKENWGYKYLKFYSMKYILAYLVKIPLIDKKISLVFTF